MKFYREKREFYRIQYRQKGTRKHWRFLDDIFYTYEEWREWEENHKDNEVFEFRALEDKAKWEQ